MLWSIRCRLKFASYAEERRLLEETVVASMDCVFPLPAETRLLVTEDDVGGHCTRKTCWLGELGRLVSR